MMDHKTVKQRGARADFQLVIAGIMEDENRRKALIEKYSNGAKHLESQHVQRILIGNWLHNGAIMILKGATEDEVNRVAEHIVVLLDALKYNLDVYQSHKDHNLLELAEKYLVEFKKTKVAGEDIYYKHEEGSVLEKRKKEHERALAHRKEMQEKIQNYLDSGCTCKYIADELGVPESTVRNIMKYHD